MTRVSSAVAWLDPLLAVLLLLPAAWLAFPSTLAHQLEPELSATGWWVLLQLPAALVLLVRTPRPSIPLITLFAVFVGFSLLSMRVLSPSDTLSSSRAILAAIASLCALCAGSALGPSGRRVFVQGLVVISICLCGPVVWSLWNHVTAPASVVAPRIQGALQNSGATSEAGLLGALAALALFWNSTVVGRIVALVAIAAYAAFVSSAPVVAGILVFLLVACIAVGMRYRNRSGMANRRGLALGLAVFLLAAAAAYAATHRNLDEVRIPSTPQQAPTGGNLGGVAVRLSIAPRALALLGEHLWLGVGPGQFRATYPAYRGEEERRLSNAAAGVGVETEVEHAHNDVLTTLDEAGILGGLAWIAMNVWLAIAAIRALRQHDGVRIALALAVLGVLGNAWLRAPLSFNPASASLFFAGAGAVIARDDEAVPSGSARRLLSLLCLGLLALQAPRAWNFVQHGRALRVPDGIDLPKALAACPDSPLALSLHARKLAADPARIADARAAWDEVLRLRPLNFEALVQAGVLAAQTGEFAAATDHWQRALELAPERVGVLQNLLLLEARTGKDGDFEPLAARAHGDVARLWAIDAGAKELLDGNERAALRLWKFAGSEWTEELPQKLYDRSRAATEETSPLSKAQEMLAHLRWGRELEATGAFAAAVRSFRQALRIAPQARAVQLELAAALWSDGKQDEARAEIERARPRAEDWAGLAPWAGEVLLHAGLLPAR